MTTLACLLLLLLPIGGKTAEIHNAVAAGDLAKIESILTADPKQLAATDDVLGFTPLQTAAYIRQVKAAELLIAKGAKVDIFSASALGRLNDVTALLKADKTILNAKTKDGRTPLLWASLGGSKAVVGTLLNKGADINTRNAGGVTALHDAAHFAYKDLADFLLSKGADINAKSVQGDTPLITALMNDRFDIAEMLIGKGALVNLQNAKGYAALHFAALASHQKLVELLLSKEADPNLTNDVGASALHSAVSGGLMNKVDCRPIAELLLSKGAGVNAKDKYGSTPLAAARIWKMDSVIELLKLHGAVE